MSGTQRLNKLLDLANWGPSMRAALAEEVAELLLNWPTDCPIEARAPCEAVLARTAREVDGDARARLRIKLRADPALAARILAHEQDRLLVEAARKGDAMAPHLARALNITESRALEILCDSSGHALAVAAKAMNLNRAAFSSLVLLACPIGDSAGSHRRLDAFDALSVLEPSRAQSRRSAQTALS